MYNSGNKIVSTFSRFSLNVVSLRSADNLHGLVLLNTHFTACGSAILWLIVVSLRTPQSSCVDILYGVMAGLAGFNSRTSCNNRRLFHGHFSLSQDFPILLFKSH